MESMELEVAGPSSQEDNGARRSKVCAVCGGESQTYHLNFGVGTCNSCRAFFRRSVQVGEKLPFSITEYRPEREKRPPYPARCRPFCPFFHIRARGRHSAIENGTYFCLAKKVRR